MMAGVPPSVTLTSLLNSLHSYLQSQTQLLPTLHAQLGLPPSALEDELKALEKQLMQSVESQIDLRRKEVEQWMDRCEAVEYECLRYSKALGGNSKSTGSSVGELRKEQMLPRRYELLTEHQEKLRQLYHTKLEQLTTLTNRLKALSRTLGKEYFPQDALDPTSAPGENLQDKNANLDVTSERFLKLEKELVKGKAEVTKRLNQLSTTFIQIDWLYTELGMPPPALEDLPSTSNTKSFASSLSALQKSSSSNVPSPSDPFSYSTPTPGSRTRPITPLLFQDDTLIASEAEYQQIFARFVARIEEADEEHLQESPTVPIGLENVDPTPGLLTWASNLQSSLEEVKRRREAHIQAMYDQLEGLWRRLGVEEADMDAFVETHRGSTEETVREYEDELERMLELKRERMGTFIASARDEIVRLWDDLMIGEDERADFAPFVDDEHTEELLTIHEDEIRRLKEERRLKAPLLSSIKKYFDICSEEKELAAAASDQTRLLGRGRDAGRLLREEKMRKRVAKEKPRLEQDLVISIPAWEEETGRPFLVHGESMLRLLMETVSAADQENKRKPSRAGSVPPRATTPLNLTQSYVPGGRAGSVTPAVRSGGSSQSVPNKRQKLGEPARTVHHRQGSGNGNSNGQTSGVARAPLGSYRANSVAPTARSTSPSKIPSKTPGSSSGKTGLPRPVTTIHMPVPKPGTHHHILGHGRIPAVGGFFRSTSGMTSSGTAAGRYASGSGTYAAGAMKKANRARRESFRPRPSIDMLDVRVGAAAGRWPGFGGSVKEEEEVY